MKESNIIHEINMDNIKNEEALVGSTELYGRRHCYCR